MTACRPAHLPLIAAALSLAACSAESPGNETAATAEARQAIEPVVKLHRELASRNRGDQTQKLEMAAALYAAALADPERHATLLQESRALLEGLPASVKALASTRVWSERVRAAIG